ncbi:DUF2378 family protein [Vitiosangium sp. GDMCC 1.1324]|uniref:DUF2378 family protein n=1 Tax=Vitiosangium sp. (strain GDMCC 1.1324) TaxID=2138576 RepID=UPI000D3D3ABF|nr:DUF2378 family protein [Vitiosangium sp. GDMCC 1.1324]PTL81989.1 hypothetical protein DAT35_19435 [Vitiosangium sp. GDMCC 1.1324]
MDTRDALLRRVALSAPEARTHGQHYEDVLLGVSELFGASVSEEVRSLVPEAVSPGSFNYPVADLLHLCDAAASTAELRTGSPYGESLEQLGTFIIRRFFNSPLGKALWMRVPREMHESLRWSVVSVRSAFMHGQRRYEKLGPLTARIFFRGELLGPSWMRGIFLGGIQMHSQQPLSASIEHMSASGMEFTLRFTW